jgi:phosphoglycolate phosphatase-like HAD superfamily hydrolase
MLIIFDVDGTLVGGETQDCACFDQAIAAVVGLTLDSAFFDSLLEITAQAIAESSVRAAMRNVGTGLEETIRDEYLRRLREAHSRDVNVFPPRQGTHALLAHLSTIPGINIAIATGCWQATSSFKLNAAGIDVSTYAMATSSDTRSRAEIIRLAAQRAGRSLSDAVYVGDGLWDWKASQDVGIPFIGTGLKLDRLKAAGVEHTLEKFDPAYFFEMVRAVLAKATRSKQTLDSDLTAA